MVYFKWKAVLCCYCYLLRELPNARLLMLITYFYPNVTTLRSGLCYRKSVSRLSVCNVGAPYLGVEVFGNISSPLCTVAIIWPPCKSLKRSSQESPLRGGVKRKRYQNWAMVDLSKAISHKQYKIYVSVFLLKTNRKKLHALNWMVTLPINLGDP